MAKSKSGWTTITLKPLTASLDTRSQPADVMPGVHRFVQNFMLSGGDKICRRPSEQKIFSGSAFDLFHLSTDPLFNPTYVNWDLHDQSDATGPWAKEAPTMLFEGFLNSGPRYLYAGTQSALFKLDQTKGTWTNLVHSLAPLGGMLAVGGAVGQTRFKAAELQNFIFVTNNVDHVLYQDVNTTNDFVPVPELKNGASDSPIGLAVSAAGVIVMFKGFILIMNTVEGGQRFTSRVRWSDLNRGDVWIGPTDPNLPPMPSGNQASLANYQDLDYGHDILAAAEMGGNLYIYTTKSIWRASIGGQNAAGQAIAFSFVSVYSEPANQAKCIFFPNSLVSTGLEHWFAGIDGYYMFSPYIPEPERSEWLYKGTTAIFTDTAYAGDISNCQSFIAQIFQEDTEIHVSWPELNTGAQPGVPTKTIIFNYKYKAVSIKDAGYTALGNFRPNAPDGNTCKTAQLFVGAAASDWCLKSISTIYSRERCANSFTGTGSVVNGVYVPFSGVYVFDGYYSILRGMLPYANTDLEKVLKHLLIEAVPDPQATPCVLRLRVGNSYSQADPNLPDGVCTVLWRQLADKPLKCLDAVKASAQVLAGVKRGIGTEWELLSEGRFLYYEFTIANADGSPAIGGSSCFERIETVVRVKPGPP